MSYSGNYLQGCNQGNPRVKSSSDGLSDQVILLNELSARLDEYFAMRNLGIDTKGG